MPLNTHPLANLSVFPALSFQLAIPVVMNWWSENTALTTMIDKQITYIVLYESQAGGPVTRRLVPNITAPTLYSTNGRNENKDRKRYM